MEVMMMYVIFFLNVCLGAETTGLSSLSLTKSLSVEKEGDYLISPKGTFSSGFYKVGTNAYSYAIWYTHSLNKTVIWMANRDKPVSSKRSSLSLQRTANLVLTDADGSIAWSSDTYSKTHVELMLLESGNLILATYNGRTVVWESFGHPTDTLVPNQPLIRNTTLVSARRPGIYLSGFYKLKFDDNNVMNLIYDGPLYSSVYWPRVDTTIFVNKRTPYNSSRIAVFNEMGSFRSSDNLKFNSTDYGLGFKRRLTLDYDGIPRLYTLDSSNGLWEISWLPGTSLDSCKVHGICGANGICGYTPVPTCFCPVIFNQTDSSDWSKGCTPRFNLSCGVSISNDELDFIKLLNTDYYGNDLNTYGIGMSFEKCKNACLNDCKCVGFGYSQDGKGECFPKRSLLNGYHMPDVTRTFHIKVPRNNTFNSQLLSGLNCSMKVLDLNVRNVLYYDDQGQKNPYIKYLIAFVGSFAVIETICIVIGWRLIFPRHIHEEFENMGYILLAMGFKRFSLAELKRATQNFKEEIGKGGFGTVYKGVIDNGRVVAVKRLEGVLQGEAEFWAEVSIIGKLNHKNLVKLWGFCVDDDQKLLVYEYMENGSLDKNLSSLDFDKRYNIALGTAKGLLYIHEECLEWILHCDVKPQNILLDERHEAKVADFGMSKLLKDNSEVNDTSFSRVRGTRGYLAPEWMKNQTINAKADVYSYGIVLLELISGKRAWFPVVMKQDDDQHEGSLSSVLKHKGHNHLKKDDDQYYLLVDWVREKMKEGKIMEVLDPSIGGEYDKEKVERLMRVALMCVLEDRDKRPAMSEVVELLTQYDECSQGQDDDV
ncbi:putative receptor protein kinase ZmPK1 [Impatiens glandulifera]|uniref:putative receptor protein kinase ZmPK1 n=1 Tax=Impatiens glandulifera TaxID=253017 RepID=UPI001FB14ED7|nr:putative receptor protein kinase ZmPK1 [Impatiens glandulifera]